LEEFGLRSRSKCEICNLGFVTSEDYSGKTHRWWGLDVTQDLRVNQYKILGVDLFIPLPFCYLI
jgi:hypothetical protein